MPAVYCLKRWRRQAGVYAQAGVLLQSVSVSKDKADSRTGSRR
jgi:hypothetical protein